MGLKGTPRHHWKTTVFRIPYGIPYGIPRMYAAGLIVD